MAIHEVALHRAAETGRCEEALEQLREEIGVDAVDEPDDAGMFAVEVEAPSFDEAVQEVRAAIAAVGADECFEFGESSGYVPADE